jgi:hypothetical protein
VHTARQRDGHVLVHDQPKGTLGTLQVQRPVNVVSVSLDGQVTVALLTFEPQRQLCESQSGRTAAKALYPDTTLCCPSLRRPVRQSAQRLLSVNLDPRIHDVSEIPVIEASGGCHTSDWSEGCR